MPRNPNSPHINCGPTHTPINASENLKLQLLASKLEEKLRDEFVLKSNLKTINSINLIGEGNIDINSISKIEKTASEGLIDTYTIYFNNNLEPFSFTVTNGEKGERGDDFKFEDFTEEQLALLKGEKGDKGEDGKDFTYDMFTEEQLAALKGEKGDKGDTGEALTYEMLTDEQKAELKGKDGLTIAIQVGETLYTHEEGLIKLPAYLTEHQSLEDYTTKEEIRILENNIGFVKVDDRSFAEVIDETFAKKEDIPSIEGLATKEEVQAFENRIGFNNINPDITLCQAIEDNYATKEELEKVQTVAGNNSVLIRDIESELVDLQNNKADKSEIPSVEGLVSKEYVDNAVSNNKQIYYYEIETYEDTSITEGQDRTFAVITDELREFADRYVKGEKVALYISTDSQLFTTQVNYHQPIINGVATDDLHITYHNMFSRSSSSNGDGFQVLTNELWLRKDELNQNWKFARLKYDLETDADFLPKEETVVKIVNDAIANIEHPTVDLTGYATETFVEEKIAAIPPVDLSNYATLADLQIGADFVTETTVGFLKAGTQIKSTMTLGSILKAILCDTCPHEWIDATCTTPKTCKLCGKTEGEPLGHLEEVIKGKAATCTESGLTDGVKCSRCGEILVTQQVIPALGHDPLPAVGENRIEPTETSTGSYDLVVYCNRCGEELSRETIEIPMLEPVAFSYLSGTFGNPDVNQEVQDWPAPFVAVDEYWNEDQKAEISMHYVNNMSEVTVESLEDLKQSSTGRYVFNITTPFVSEPDFIRETDGFISEDPYLTRPAVILPKGYIVTAWNTDSDNNSLSDCAVYSYNLVDGRTVYYSDYQQLTGITVTHYLTIVKN